MIGGRVLCCGTTSISALQTATRVTLSRFFTGIQGKICLHLPNPNPKLAKHLTTKHPFLHPVGSTISPTNFAFEVQHLSTVLEVRIHHLATVSLLSRITLPHMLISNSPDLYIPWLLLCHYCYCEILTPLTRLAITGATYLDCVECDQTMRDPSSL